jgi:hypothetical protein
MKKIIFSIAVFTVALNACTTKSYNCRCIIDLPDTAGFSLDVDTIFVVNARLEEEANVKCLAAQEASSFLSAQYEAAGAGDINCTLE